VAEELFESVLDVLEEEVLEPDDAELSEPLPLPEELEDSEPPEPPDADFSDLSDLPEEPSADELVTLEEPRLSVR
jgi:hypothetical protein